jgi:hypothetical protein
MSFGRRAPRMHWSIVCRLVPLLFVFAQPLGCAGLREATHASQPGAPYTGHLAELFDDAIEPAAVGLDFDRGYSPRLDTAFRERVQVGDSVVRVRITTITAKTDGPYPVFLISVRSVEKLVGTPPEGTFEVQVSKASESYGILKSFEGRLVGRPFLAFLKEFSGEVGEREIHFHFAPDTPEVRAAVLDAALLVGFP